MKQLLLSAALLVLTLSSVQAQLSGTVVAWGYNGYGQADVPEGLSDVTAIAAGEYHTVALKADGTVVAWGDDGAGQTDVPEGLSGVIAIAAGYRHTVALKSDGTVVAWGENRFGETDVPGDLNGVIAIAAGGGATGGTHTVALKGDGTVVAWGDVTVPEGLSGVIAIAAGWGYTMALKDNGTVVAWDSVGWRYVPTGLNGVTAIATSGNHSVALKGDGAVVAWGGGSPGQTENPADVPEGLSGVTAIAAGNGHTVALKGDGTVVAWGDHIWGWGQSDVPEGLSGVTAVAAGLSHTVVLVGEDLPPTLFVSSVSRNVAMKGGNHHFNVMAPSNWSWSKSAGSDWVTTTEPASQSGDQTFSYVVAANPDPTHSRVATFTLTNGVFTVTHTITQADGIVVAWGDNWWDQRDVPEGLSGVTAIAAGGAHTVVLKGDGTVVALGWNFYGQLNVPEGLSGVTAIAAGDTHTVALKGDGTVVVWGDNGYYGPIPVPEGLSDVTAIAAGGEHTMALKKNGTVVAWDKWGGAYGGDMSSELSGVTAIAAGGSHAVALKKNGTVVAWDKWGRQWEDGDDMPAGLNGVIAIAAGWRHTVALKGNGTVVAWGDNSYGQADVPAGLKDVIAIAAGDSHTVVLKRDGTVVAWGHNSDGQTDVPEGLSDVAAIAAGGDQTVALISPRSPSSILIRGNGVTIPLGSTTPSLANFTDFGNVNVTGGTVARNFTLANVGEANLNLTSSPRVQISGPHASDFTVTAQPASPLAGNSSTTFQISFDPSALGLRPATISIANDDEARNPYVFDIQGTGSDLVNPALHLTNAPAANKLLILTQSSLGITGTVTDNLAVDRVEITLNGNPIDVTFIHSSPVSASFSAEIFATHGPNTLVITAYDQANRNVTLTRSFTFERRHEFTLARKVLPAGLGTPLDKAGVVAFKALPAKNASKLTQGPASQTSNVMHGTFITLTANAKAKHLFSHWEGLPPDAEEAGNLAIFPMPEENVAIVAVFIENPFLAAPFNTLGAKPLFHGLLRPEAPAPSNNTTVGLFTAALVPAKGSLSGKVFMDGKVTSFTAMLQGGGARHVWFKVGKVFRLELPLLDNEAQNKTLSAVWNGEGQLQVTVNGPDGTSSGLASPPLYSKTNLIQPPPASSLLNAKGKQGYYTLALFAQEPTLEMSVTTYPQGTGYSSLTLMNNGVLKLAGVLADGTKITLSSFLVAGEGESGLESALFMQLPTPGGKTRNGSLLGMLVYDSTQPNSDVSSADLQWFRPDVRGTPVGSRMLAYKAGWPGGITLEAIGALYDGTQTVQATLGLDTASDPVELFFAEGKLNGPVSVSTFHIDKNKVIKQDNKDKTFTLSFTPKGGFFKGTFAPDWTGAKLPAFNGILLQKGENRGGDGFFLSNHPNPDDLLNPESGSVTLEKP